MKKIFILSIINLIYINSIAQDWKWAYNIGSNLAEGCNIKSDKYDNLYLYGGFRGSKLIFKSDTLNIGNGNYFLAKLDNLGNKIWFTQLYDSSPNTCFQIHFSYIDDYSSSIYLAGTFCNTINISGHVFNNNHETGFLARFDLDGNCYWAKSIKCSRMVEINCSTDDGNGNLFISGYVQDSANFDSYRIGGGSFIAKYDTTGICTWVKNICTADVYPFLPYISVLAIKYKNNSLYISASEYNDTIIIDTLLFIHPNKGGNIIGKYDINGNRIWLKEQVGVYTEPSFDGIDVDQEENIYTSGYFRDTISVEGTSYFTRPGGQEYFLSKYDSAGRNVWFKQGYGNKSIAQDLKCDADGNFYVTGYFTDTTQFGNQELIAGSPSDMFLARFDKNAELIGIKRIFDAKGYNMAVDNQLNATVISSFNDSVLIDGQYIYSYGDYDILITQSDKITGISETSERIDYTLKIFQNPNNGKFNIQIPDEIINNDNVELFIYNSNGILVQSMPIIINREVIPVNIQAQAKGTYVVKLRSKNKSYTGKLIFVN